MKNLFDFRSGVPSCLALALLIAGATYAPAQSFYTTNGFGGPASGPYNFGNPGDVPLAGHFNNVGTVTYAIYRPSNQTFYIASNVGAPYASAEIPFGAPGDIPIAGDWTGDGITKIGVYRPTTTSFYLRFSSTETQIIPFGNVGDIPLAGDWDGNGTASPGVYRPSTQTFYLTNVNTSGTAVTAWQTTYFGAPGDVPVVGDWNGDGTTTIGIVRGNHWYLTNQGGPTFSQGYADFDFLLGNLGDVPVVGQWNGTAMSLPGLFRSVANFNNDIGVQFLSCDDCFSPLVLSFTFNFGGTSGLQAYVGSNGYITFGAGDSTYGESVSTFNDLPRIAAFFDDLYPVGFPAAVYVNNTLPGESIITYFDAPHYGLAGTNNIQVQLYSDGRIILAYQGIASLSTGTIVGINPGSYAPIMPVDFQSQPSINIPAGTGIYEYFTGTQQFNLDYSFLVFTPQTGGGYNVKTY